MTQEQFFDQENKRREAEQKLRLSSDKAYHQHLKNLEALTKRQVIAQETMLKKLAQLLAQQDTRSTQKPPRGKQKIAPNEPNKEKADE